MYKAIWFNKSDFYNVCNVKLWFRKSNLLYLQCHISRHSKTLLHFGTSFLRCVERMFPSVVPELMGFFVPLIVHWLITLNGYWIFLDTSDLNIYMPVSCERRPKTIHLLS